MTGQMQGEAEARSPTADNEDIVLVTACHKGQRLPLAMVKYMMMLKGLASAYQVSGEYIRARGKYENNTLGNFMHCVPSYSSSYAKRGEAGCTNFVHSCSGLFYPVQ
jgi:hypothetical protein